MIIFFPGTSTDYQAPLQYQTAAGRPSFIITQQQLNAIMSCRFPVTQMANMLQVSAQTISRRLRLQQVSCSKCYLNVNCITMFLGHLLISKETISGNIIV